MKRLFLWDVSAGGYASVLFGSLCNNVTHVVSFVPQIKLNNLINPTYSNLKTIINPKVKYTLFGDTNIHDINDLHHISHCEIIKDFENVTLIRKNGIELRTLRDNGTIKKIIDTILSDISDVSLV